MLAQLSGEEKAAYRALMRVVLAAPRVITAEIADDCGFGLSDHLALEQLSDAPDGQLRMMELAEACGVSLSGITRIMSRLDDAGLTTRVRCRGDARGALAVLTPAGRAKLERVRPVHQASIRWHIFDQLGDVDLAAFASGLEGIACSMLADGGERYRSALTLPQLVAAAYQVGGLGAIAAQLDGLVVGLARLLAAAQPTQ